MTEIERFKCKMDSMNENGCILWLGWKNHDGYGKFSVGKIYKFAHRYAYELFIAPIPKGIQVLHKCDIRDCCNPEHLFLGTHKDNMQDMIIKGRFDRKGSKNGRARLNEIDVIAIKGALRNGLTVAKLARLFKVSEGAISFIKHGRSWKHITI